MSALLISSAGLQLYLHPVSSLSRLTHLEIFKYHDEEEGNNDASELLVDLSPLPATLKYLRMAYTCVDPACFKYIKCVELTSLDIHWTTNTAAEICNLLQHLPKLKVLTYAGLYPSPTSCFQLPYIACHISATCGELKFCGQDLDVGQAEGIQYDLKQNFNVFLR